MKGVYMLTAANILRLEEKPFEIPRGIISFSPLPFSPPFIPFSPVSPVLHSTLKQWTIIIIIIIIIIIEKGSAAETTDAPHS